MKHIRNYATEKRRRWFEIPRIRVARPPRWLYVVGEVFGIIFVVATIFAWWIVMSPGYDQVAPKVLGG